MNDAKYIGLEVRQATISVAVLDFVGKLVMEAVYGFYPKPISRRLLLMNKDFGLILDMARAKNAPTPATEPTFRISNSALPSDGNEDMSGGHAIHGKARSGFAVGGRRSDVWRLRHAVAAFM
jgi:hypothetical protein